MLDASNFGTVCVKVHAEKDMKLIFEAIKGETELVLTQDLIIGDKVLDEGKYLGLVGKELVNCMSQARQELAAHHRLSADARGEWRYEPAVDLCFLNMSAVKESCGQLDKVLKKQDIEKRKKNQQELEARLEEQEQREDVELLQEAGDLSYKVPARDWVVPETACEDMRESADGLVKGGAPKPLDSSAVLGAGGARKEKRITRFMTAEPDAKGVVKVYVEEPDVIQCETSKIQVMFTMNTYTVRVQAEPVPLVLGPIDCGVIDPEASSWRLSRGKRLTVSLVLSEAGKQNARLKKQWEDMQARAKARKEAGDGSGTESGSTAEAPEPAGAAKTLEPKGASEGKQASRATVATFAVGVLLAFLAMVLLKLAS